MHPDLLPADITGSYVYDPAEARFVFRPGPVFTGLLLADEINRTAPKTQSALLEAMAERQVSVEGRSFLLDLPFHVMATSNPVEYEGTYPLPEAQLDRFMVRLAVGYPSPAGEADVLTRRLARRTETTSVERIVDGATVLRMQAGVETVDVDPDIVDYCVALVAGTRTPPGRRGRRIARADRSRCCWSPERSPCWTGATSSRPRTSSRSLCRRWRTGSRSTRRPGRAGRARPTSYGSSSARSPGPTATARVR